MSRPRETVRSALLRHLPRGVSVLVAVSGGLDSTVLLHACSELKVVCRLRNIGVAHIDHALRPESGDDAAFVRSLCEQLALPFFVTKLKPPEAGVNIEQWGRNARYLFLSSTARDQGFDLILTAHTANDAAENLLMRLLSNKEPRPIALRDPSRRLLRPILHVPREEVRRFAEARGVAWREDRSNQDTRLLRNRVRHELLPLLTERFDARIVEVLSNRAQALQEDMVLLDRWANRVIDRLERLHPFGTRAWLRAIRARLSSVPKGLQWRLVETFLRKPLGFRLGRTQAKLVLNVVAGKAVAHQLPGGLSIRRKGGGLIIQKRAVAQME